MRLLFLRFKLAGILIPLVLLMLTACQAEGVDLPETAASSDDLTVKCTTLIPEMGMANTRGDFGDTPAENLKLTVFEFELGEDAAHSFLSNIYDATLTSSSAVANEGVSVTFKFTLKAAGTPKVLHLMVADQHLTAGFGSVASVLPAISVGTPKNDYWTPSAKEAYWGKVEFDEGFTYIDDFGNPALKDGVADKLKNVPMIRNFAKLSVDASGLDNFKLLGFEIINVPTSGTVAPWDQEELDTPELLEVNEAGRRVMKSYSDIDYPGILPGMAQFVNTEVEAKSWSDDDEAHMANTSARYLYEHPYESTRRTYILIQGEYLNLQGEWKRGFYKIDIGRRNDDGSFNYYNIIRNIHYKVKIEYVHAEGSTTLADAINRAPFNNLMASTETASMLNVSDGENILFVNATNHIIINNDKPIEILYRYQNLSGNPENAGTPQTVNLKIGNVIDSFTEEEEVTDELGLKWMKIEITPKEPSDITQRQSFSIVDGKGLGRTINLVLRKPWSYAPIKVGEEAETAIINRGIASLYSLPAESQSISAKAGEPFTVYFNLPNGLPESIFPLEFSIQAKNQAIENNKIDNMVVSTGSSLFNPAATAISYIKTVTYAEYSYQYLSDTSNDLDISTPNTNHTVRCRFLTIIPGTEEGEIRVHNSYFIPDASVKVVREN